ncbi:hypothetical protein Q3G72_020052 [Acer saccharum]|nr:hypothetical protein Q3G72_020052 [Acer saccharum]
MESRGKSVSSDDADIIRGGWFIIWQWRRRTTTPPLFMANAGRVRNGGFVKNVASSHSKNGKDNPRSGLDRKSGEEINDFRHGNNAGNRPSKNNMKNGRHVINSSGFAKPVGNRFEILNDEVEGIMNEGNLQANAKPLNDKFKGKTMLLEITNTLAILNS